MIQKLSEKSGLSNWNLLSFITFFLGCIALLPQSLILPAGTGTDFSYMQALNWIWTHHLPLKFGSDIAYTYGPLGFLCYKVASNWQLALLILLFEIYAYVNYVLILKAFMPVKSVLGLLTVFFAICFFDKQFNESTYYLIFIFSIFTFLKTDDYKYLVNAAFISVLCFFIKVNFGLVQLFLLFGVIGYDLFFKKLNRGLLITIAISVIAALLGLCFILKVSLVGYVLSSLNIIGGYNDAMVIPVSVALKRFQFAVLVLVGYNLVSLYYLYRNRFNLEMILRWFLTSLYIFIMFKYSFIRADLNKTPHAFFVFIVAAIGIQYLFEQGEYKNRLRGLALINFFLAGTIFFILNPYMGKPEVMQTVSAEFFKDLKGQAKAKLSINPQVKNNRLIPENILKKIGNAPVDLMPYNLALVFINDLNYNPRPTLQSFAAFTTYLDSLNYKKYTSNTSPRFVLFNCSGIDKREPFWDESITKRALCQYYHVADTFLVNDAYTNGYDSHNTLMERYLLLEKNASPLVPTVKPQNSGELALDEPFMVDSGPTPQYLYADLEYSLAGKAKSFLFQPPLLNVVFCYETGKTDTFRAVRPILKTGVLINKEVITARDAETFFNSNGADNSRIKWIKFVSSDGFSFKRKAKYHTELISYPKN